MKEDKIIGLILIIFSALMYYKAMAFPPAMFGTLGAGFFPKILFGLLALAGAALIISGLARGRKRDGKKAGEGKSVQIHPWDKLKERLNVYSHVITSFFFVLGYIVLMYYLGYMMATLMFMLSLMWILGPKSRNKIPMIIMISGGMTFIIYFSFLKLLQIFLPEGILF